MGAQTFNRYNLFYRLERHLLLHERGAVTKKEEGPISNEAKKFAALELPLLPPRYVGVEIPTLWFLSSKGSDKKRSHRKSHGVASFQEIARVVATNWKVCDAETMNFVTLVSNQLKDYVDEHNISTGNPTTTKPRKKAPSATSKGAPNRRGTMVSLESNEAEDTASLCRESSTRSLDTSTHGSSSRSGPKKRKSIDMEPCMPSVPLVKGRNDNILSASFTSKLSSSFTGGSHDVDPDVQLSSSFKDGTQFMSVDNTNNCNRSMTPQVTNCTTSNTDRQVNCMHSSFIRPSAVVDRVGAIAIPSGCGTNPQQQLGNYNNNNTEFVNNVEHSFLQQVLGSTNNGLEPGMVGEGRNPSTSGRPQTVEQLLAIMNNSNNSMNQLQRYHRSATCPTGLTPSTTPEFTYPPPPEIHVQQQPHPQEQQRRRMPANQRRATSVTMASSAQAAELHRQLYRQSRRASSVTFGSSMAAQQQVAAALQQQVATELDIGDEEIMGMFMRAP